MSQFQNKSFTVHLGSKAYAEGWEGVFGKPSDRPSEQVLEGLSRYDWSDIRCQVAEFHRAMGQPVEEVPQTLTKDRLALRLKLIAEEFAELLEACDVETWVNGECCDAALRDYLFDRIEHNASHRPLDLVEIADALADLDYVIEGMRLELGINGKPIANEVHRSNMSKLGADGKPVYRDDGKVIKGPNYSPPDIESELRKQGWSG